MVVILILIIREPCSMVLVILITILIRIIYFLPISMVDIDTIGIVLDVLHILHIANIIHLHGCHWECLVIQQRYHTLLTKHQLNDSLPLVFVQVCVTISSLTTCPTDSNGTTLVRCDQVYAHT